MPSRVAIILCGLLSAAQADRQPLAQMVAAERAFAAATAEIGVRNRFLTFFAPDAVQIVAGSSGKEARLAPARDALTARPELRLPPATVLSWNPHTGQTSSDGQMGWLTGPYMVMEVATGHPVGQGAYFSVWKRQPDGTWRVWLDEGIELPSRWTGASEFRAGPEPGAPAEPPETAEAAESSLAAGLSAWQTRLADSVRVHRHGRMPIVGREAAVAWAATAWTTIRFSALHTDVAGSNDLAVSVGGYDAETAAGPEHGTWARVWERDVTGAWRIVFETSRAAG